LEKKPNVEMELVEINVECREVNSTPSGEIRLETKLLMSQKLFAVVVRVAVILMDIYRTKPVSHYGRRVLGSDLSPTFV
jgi:hypothetical protein